jgi:hypothetical protein
MDAGAFGARLLPENAYRFARGEELTSSTGLRVKLDRPLDFLVVADHSDNMGFFPRLYGGDPEFLVDPIGKRWYNMIQAGGQEGVKAPPGRRRSRRPRSTTSRAVLPPSSATSGRPTPAATTCTGS